MHIINYQKLEEMFFGKTDKVEMIISALRKRIPEWLAETQDAFESKDPESIRKLCHRIRGAAGTITAERLEDAATKWGDIVKENRIAEMASGHANLVKAIKELDEYTLTR